MSRGSIIRALVVLIVSCGATSAGAADLEGGNGVFRVRVSDGEQAFKCGVWTAVTGPLHPAGPGLELLFSFNGAPINSSYTTLHSHRTGRDYTTVGECTPLCDFVGPPQVEPIEREGTIVGYRLAWTFAEPRSVRLIGEATIRFAQEVVVEGPVDGTETPDNSIVRETHTVTNLGLGLFRFGLRKMWDLTIDADDGPWLGQCAEPTGACDRSLNLPVSGSAGAPLPGAVIVRSNPPESACPPGVEPNEPDGCDGVDPWIVAASVSRASGLVPPPDPPQMLQFNWWPVIFGECWIPELVDGAECGVGGFFDDTALAYFYGLTRQTAVVLRPNESRSFTQYLTLDSASCPAILAPERRRPAAGVTAPGRVRARPG